MTNVKADKITIKSGKVGTIILDGVETESMEVTDSNGIKIDSKGENQVSNMLLNPSIESAGSASVQLLGALPNTNVEIQQPMTVQAGSNFSAGKVTVAPSQDATEHGVTLSGDFSQAANVEITKATKVTASESAVIPAINVNISTEDKANTVSFSGDFKESTLTASKPTTISVAEGSAIGTVNANAAVELTGNVNTDVKIATAPEVKVTTSEDLKKTIVDAAVDLVNKMVNENLKDVTVENAFDHLKRFKR